MAEKLLGVYVPEELHTDLKIQVAKNGTSISKVMRTLIQQYLNESVENGEARLRPNPPRY